MVSRELNEQLEVGREMDILVAEQVMGWQLETDEAKIMKLNEYFAHSNERRWWRNPEGGWHCDPLSYSTDIVAAWRVVEKLNSRGQALFLHQSMDENKAAFDDSSALDPRYISEKSVTAAICRAALAICNIANQKSKADKLAFAPAIL